MRTSDVEARLQSLLIAEGMDGPCPDPRGVWEVFKRFAAEPVDCDSDVLFFQAGDSEVMNDSYFDYCREFKLRDKVDRHFVWYEQVHVEYSTHRPHQLGYAQMELWSFDFTSPEDFFRSVEESVEFQAGLSFAHFKFRVYYRGV